MSSSSIITALVMYGKGSTANLAEMKCWQKDTLSKIAEGNGGQITSGSGNGMAFTVSDSSMTNKTWFESLTFAINKLENSQVKKGVSRVRFF